MRTIDQIIQDRKTVVVIAQQHGFRDDLIKFYKHQLNVAERSKARLDSGNPWAARIVENAAEKYSASQR